MRIVSKRSQRAFTLVELLIALALVSMILLMLFSALRLASRSWDAIEAVHDATADLRVARSFIRRTLRQARPVEGIYVDGAPIRPLSGDQQGLEWTGPLSEYLGIPGLYMIRLVVERSGDTQQLVLYRWLLHPDILINPDDWPAWTPLAEEPIPTVPGAASGEDALGLWGDLDRADGAFGRTVLLGDLKQFSASYFGMIPGTNQREWTDHWLEQRGLPNSVALWLETTDQPVEPLVVLIKGD